MASVASTLSLTTQFLYELAELPPDHKKRILRRIEELRLDPRPDGRAKVRYQGYQDVYRLKVHPYRVLYRWEGYDVTVLTVGHRRDVYRGELPVDAEAPYRLIDGSELLLASVIGPHSDTVWAESIHHAVDVTSGTEPGDSHPEQHPGDMPPLPERPHDALADDADDLLSPPITPDLLDRIGITDPNQRAILLECRTEGQLLGATVPPEVIEAVIDALWPEDEEDEEIDDSAPSLDAALDAPAYIIDDLCELDLIEWERGQAPLQWRLRLDPQQQEIVQAIANGPGPFVVRGGPGSGKTTVALYATRAFLESARARGIRFPRLLYVTYTRSLAKVAEDQLRIVLGPDAGRVRVSTVDSLVIKLARCQEPDLQIADDEWLGTLFERARQEAFSQLLSPEAAQLRREARALAKLSNAYLLQEIEVIIENQGIESLEKFLTADRKGRGIGLTQVQRAAVWRLRETFYRLLAEEGRTTWALARRKALQAAREGLAPEAYDAVLVDEVQDLNPLSLQVVLSLCRSPEWVLLVGDTGQSIYWGGMRWQQVLSTLSSSVKGWTLRRGHRGTPGIHRAAAAYLQHGGAGVPDGTLIESHRRQRTERLPALLRVRSPQLIYPALVEWLEEAMDTIGAQRQDCAVLVPTNREAEIVTDELLRLGLDARFVRRGDSINFARSEVPVMTWSNAKGQEFPIVAVTSMTWAVPGLRNVEVPEERQELIDRWRRTAYVAMTRATEALAVVVPMTARSPLLDGLGGDPWDVR